MSVKSELTSLVIHVAVKLHRNLDNEEEFTVEQLDVLSQALLSFHDGDTITGQPAEDLFHDVYQSTYKASMKQTEDSQDWNGEIDWRHLTIPKVVLVTIATRAAQHDAVRTKQWYRYCASPRPQPQFPSGKLGGDDWIGTMGDYLMWKGTMGDL